MSARANVVLPAPRSPDSVMRSPGSSALAMSIAKRRVASSSGKVSEKLAPAGAVNSMWVSLLRRRQAGGFGEWENTRDRGALSHGGIDRYLAAVQFDKRADQGEPDSGAAMLRAEGMSFEPVEHLFQHIGRNARPHIGHREDDRIRPALGHQSDDRSRRRKTQGIGQKIEQNLPQAQLVRDKTADIRGHLDVERD